MAHTELKNHQVFSNFFWTLYSVEELSLHTAQILCVYLQFIRLSNIKRIERDVIANKRATILQIMENLNQGVTAKVSKWSVGRTLKRIGYGTNCSNASCSRQNKMLSNNIWNILFKALLSVLNKSELFQFAKEHKDWTVDD